MIMEILNNIWTALTTENAFLTKIVNLPSLVIELYLSFLLFTKILKIEYTKKQKYIYVISLSIFGIINTLFIPSPYSTLLNYIVLFIFVKYLFKLNILKSILTIIIPFAIFGLITVLILNPFLKLFNFTFDNLESIPIYRFAYLCVTYLIAYIIIKFIGNKEIKFILHTDLDKHTKYIIFGNLILGLLTLVLQAFITKYYVSFVPVIITLLNFILLFSYFFLSFYSLTRVIELHIKTRDLENAESYNNTLSILYDNVKGFKHDFDNMVNIIDGYIQVDDIDGLKKYFSSLERDCSRVNNVQMLNPNIINNPGIYNLIVSKYKKATDLDVTIHFEFFFDFDNLKMPIYEFSKILGILLDNAIEAAKECEEKVVNLIFRESRKQQVQLVRIENTYLNKDIDTNQIFEKGFSQKEDHTGIGLWEVNQIIKKNNNIVLNTTKDDKYFKQELQIYF